MNLYINTGSTDMVRLRIDLPYICDKKIISKYLIVLKQNEYYDAWTLNENLEVVKCQGIIKKNDDFNYHTNSDDSQLQFYVKINNKTIGRWFSLNKDEVIEYQRKYITEWKKILQDEISRIDSIAL